MVSTSRPSASAARYVQELTGSPSTSTVQVPHTWTSHDRLAPVRASRSRSTSSSSSWGSTSMVLTLAVEDGRDAHRQPTGRDGDRDRSTRRTQAAQYSSRNRSWYFWGRSTAAESAGMGRPVPSEAQMDWKRTARSRVTAVSTAQRTSSPAMTTPWLRSRHARREPRAAATGAALARLRDQRRALVVDTQAVGEQDRIVGQELERRVGRTQRRAVQRVPVDDRVHVVAGTVDLGMHHRFQVVVGRRQGARVVQVERDDVAWLDLVERDTLALDPDGPAAWLAAADVPERQVDVPLERDDAARDGDLFPEDVERGHATGARRSVGG